MTKQNITIALDRRLLRQARVLAAERSTSVSRLIGDELVRLVEHAGERARAKRRALAALEVGFHLGGRPPSRDTLHER